MTSPYYPRPTHSFLSPLVANENDNCCIKQCNRVGGCGLGESAVGGSNRQSAPKQESKQCFPEVTGGDGGWSFCQVSEKNWSNSSKRCNRKPATDVYIAVKCRGLVVDSVRVGDRCEEKKGFWSDHVDYHKMKESKLHDSNLGNRRVLL